MKSLVFRGLRAAALMIGLGLAFTVFGIYGTSRLPFGVAWAYWTGTMVVGFGAATFIAPWVFDGPLKDRSPWLQVPVAATLITIPITAALLLIEGADGTPVPLSVWPVNFAYVFLITLVITSANYVLSVRKLEADRAAELEAQLQRAARPASASERPGAAFLEKLPMKHRNADLYAVESEDHYLRVRTSAGQAMILMRLADAVAMLGGIEGLQTHRSWWVARDGLADVKKDGQRIILVLKDGAEAPVSRANAPRVREAGWA